MAGCIGHCYRAKYTDIRLRGSFPLVHLREGDVLFTADMFPPELDMQFELIDVVGRRVAFKWQPNKDGKARASSLRVLDEPLVGEVENPLCVYWESFCRRPEFVGLGL